MNISKKFIILIFLLFSSIVISCSKDLHFSGISENSVNEILENYQNKDGSIVIPKILRPYMNNLEKISLN